MARNLVINNGRESPDAAVNEAPGFGDEEFAELFEYPGIAPLIGSGGSGAPNATANAKVVELRGIRGKTGLDITEAVTGGELSEHHGEEVVVA
jgi:hypothetical protein